MGEWVSGGVGKQESGRQGDKEYPEFHRNPDGPTFEFLVERCRQAGLTGDEVYEAIIVGSYRTNEGVNKLLGL
jgi:hypothetical protein